jgi:hypothetical protein
MARPRRGARTPSRRGRGFRRRPSREAGQPIPNPVLRRIPLRWTWWKLSYLYGGLIGIAAGLIGFVSGRLGIGAIISISTIVMRRLILWFDIFRVEPRVVQRTWEVIRLERYILNGPLSIKSYLLSVLLIFFVLPLVAWPRGDGPLLPFLAVALFFSLVLLSEFTPPFVLFLGSSEHSYGLFHKVAAGCVPHRAITLLVQGGWAIDKWRARTADPTYWRDAVRRLARISCVVVLDSRISTDALNEECDWLLTEGMDYKLVVVGDASGRCPVLDATLSRLGSGVTLDRVVITTVETVQGVVNVLAERRLHLPSAEHPASSVLAAHADGHRSRCLARPNGPSVMRKMFR